MSIEFANIVAAKRQEDKDDIAKEQARQAGRRQNCGNCKWWGRNKFQFGDMSEPLADCSWPCPPWVERSRTNMYPHEGSNCPVWVYKGNE